MADPPTDVWYRPYDFKDDVEAAMRQYLDWEVDLVPQVERDGDADLLGSEGVVHCLPEPRAVGKQRDQFLERAGGPRSGKTKAIEVYRNPPQGRAMETPDPDGDPAACRGAGRALKAARAATRKTEQNSAPRTECRSARRALPIASWWI